MKYLYLEVHQAVVAPENPEFYAKVNPGAIPVKPTRGGWKPIDSKRWGGQLPIKAKLLTA